MNNMRSQVALVLLIVTITLASESKIDTNDNEAVETNDKKQSKRGLIEFGYGGGFGGEFMRGIGGFGIQGREFIGELGYHHHHHPIETVKTVVIHKKIGVPVPHPVPYHVIKKIPVPVKVHVPVPVPKPYPVHVPKPYHVIVPKPVPFIVEKKVPYPVKVPIKVPVPHPFPVSVPKPVPYIVHKPVPYPVKVPIVVKKPVPILFKEHPHHHHHEEGIGEIGAGIGRIGGGGIFGVEGGIGRAFEGGFGSVIGFDGIF